MRTNIIKGIAIHLFVVVISIGAYAVAEPLGYYIENEKFLRWSEAFKFCKEMNMTLFNVRNKDEFDYLKTIIKQRYHRILPYWLGAYRLDGIYMWLPSCDQIENFMWHAGEPNDKSGQENCIHTWDNEFDWNDNDCQLKLPFICQLEGDE